MKSESEGGCGAAQAKAKAKARSLQSQFRQMFLSHCGFLGLLGPRNLS